MSRALTTAVVSFALAGFAASATAQDASRFDSPYVSPKGYVAYKAPKPLTIDGKADEPIWREVPWTDRFVDIEGDLKPKPRFATRAKMLWDDTYFYIYAQLDEPHVWGTLTKHDSVIFQDNDFEVFVDPDGDNHEYFEFEINALNTNWDLFLDTPYRDGGPARNEYEADGWKTAVSIDGTLNKPTDLDRGWSVEMAIPWSAFAKFAHKPIPPKEGDQWRVNFSRVEWQHQIVGGKYQKVPKTKEDNWVWSPQGVVDMHRPELWGYVQFAGAAENPVKLTPDFAGPARHRLLQIYHAQNDYKKANGKYAADVRDLGLDPKRQPVTTVRTKGDGYEATVIIPAGYKQIQPWMIRQDSKITSGPVVQAPRSNY